MSSFSKSGTIVDIINRKMFPGTLHISNNKIKEIVTDTYPKSPHYIMPGFIDSHIHIESSMLIPSEFARLASVHGTVATVSDPHEIANVLGIEGIRYMLQNANLVPFHFFFGASPCVPATTFETAGATISPKDIETLFLEDQLKYLSEMMNYPGVLGNDPTVLEKISIAQKLGKPVDGHAPGLRGPEAEAYIKAGISTDHECFTLAEALDKISYGMKILIREGSAAKNYEALHTLLKTHPEKCMLCSDDKHPNELVKGHINELVKRSVVEKGYALMDVLRAASLNPVLHYKLDVGLLRGGDSADFIIIDNLKDFSVLETYVKGSLIAKDGKTLIESVRASTPNHFDTKLKDPSDFLIEATSKKIHIIHPDDGQLVTRDILGDAVIKNGYYVTAPERDLLKLAVVNRYQNVRPAVAFVENFGLKNGAIASCIAHDSHNIIAVGCTDADLARAINLIIENKGGISAVNSTEEHILPLPVAGIMSQSDGYKIAKDYEEIDRFAKSLGTKLYAPFMTLSFLALLVIPELKLSDKGLFNGKKFSFTSLDEA